MSLATLSGLAFLILFGLVLGVFIVLNRRRAARPPLLRPIPAFDRLPEILGEAVESGRRLHLSLGSGVIGQADTATTLAGLTAAGQVAAKAVASDRPPIVTAADGSAMLLAQDGLKQVYRQQNALERFEPGAARVAGLSPMSFGAALTPLVQDEAVAGNILVGPAGTESLLVAEAGQRAGIATLAGTDNLAAQAAFFAVADHSLLGEDVFAAGAYLGRARAHLASLQAQDWMRLVLIGAIVLGALAKTFGIEVLP